MAHPVNYIRRRAHSGASAVMIGIRHNGPSPLGAGIKPLGLTEVRWLAAAADALGRTSANVPLSIWLDASCRLLPVQWNQIEQWNWPIDLDLTSSLTSAILTKSNAAQSDSVCRGTCIHLHDLLVTGLHIIMNIHWIFSLICTLAGKR